MITIDSYHKGDEPFIIKLCLHFQNDGTRPIISVSQQPDLLHIKEHYLDNGGGFWVAKDNELVVGTIALQRGEDDVYILKKFFVYEPYQGEPHHLGRQLYRQALDFAKEHGAKAIILDTPQNTIRAHRFYEKAGFKQVAEQDLPFLYQHPYDSGNDFFILKL